MFGSRITVLTANRQTRRQVARALSSGGIATEFVERAAELDGDHLARDLIVLDGDGGEPASIEDALARIESCERVPPVVLLSLAADKANLIDLIRKHDISNLVAKHGAIRAVHPVLDERELLVTCEKVLRRNIFGIEKYVGSWGVMLHKKLVTSTNDKLPLLAEFEAFLRNLDCPTSVIPSIVTVAEELLLNAVVHAPHDADGQPRYEHLGASPELVLKPDEYVEVVYGCDGQRLMLSVTDRFGRLNKATLYSYLTRGFSDNIEVEKKAGGAGLGLSLAYRSIHQLIFNIQDQRRTEVIAGWWLRVNTAGEFRHVSKSLNLFWLPRDSEPLGDAPSVVTVSGRIDESTPLAELSRASAVDVRGVTGISSRGVLRWMSALEERRGPALEIRGLTEPLVQAATQVSGFLRNAAVRTVLYPFECAKCSREQLLESPPATSRPEGGECECGGTLSFSGLEEQYAALARVLSG